MAQQIDVGALQEFFARAEGQMNLAKKTLTAGLLIDLWTEQDRQS